MNFRTLLLLLTFLLPLPLFCADTAAATSTHASGTAASAASHRTLQRTLELYEDIIDHIYNKCDLDEKDPSDPINNSNANKYYDYLLTNSVWVQDI